MEASYPVMRDPSEPESPKLSPIKDKLINKLTFYNDKMIEGVAKILKDKLFTKLNLNFNDKTIDVTTKITLVLNTKSLPLMLGGESEGERS